MEVEIYPSAKDLLAILAIVWQENESLRERSGVSGLTITRRVFTSDDLSRGRALGLSASVSMSGSVTIHSES